MLIVPTMRAPSGGDEQHIAEALSLAAGGAGAVEPNPMVGAVIVRDGEVIARGYHKRFGGPHAEIEAFNAAANAGIDVVGATMYVTLEPCCHHGKTPPCAAAIIEARIARVVIAMEDPDAQVAGKGIAQLREAGIQVQTGVFEDQARRMLSAYIKLRTKRRPWVTCKWAQTPSGLIALGESEGRWISSAASREKVHELRSRCDGILVGAGTVSADDPLLTNRSGAGRQPARIVLDGKLRTPPDCQLVRTAGESPVIIATTRQAIATDAIKAESLWAAGVELLELPAGPNGIDLDALLDELGKRNWTHLLVEGGAGVLQSFVYDGYADELLVFISPNEPAEDTANLPRFDIAEVRKKLNLREPSVSQIGGDELLQFVLTT